MGTLVEGFFVRDKDCFVVAADIEALSWTKLGAHEVDCAAGFAEDAVCRDGNDVERIMRNGYKRHLRLETLDFGEMG